MTRPRRANDFGKEVEGCQHRFRTENDRYLPIRRAQYNPALECKGPYWVAIEEAASVSRRYVQVKTGHAVTDTYLQSIERYETDVCRECYLRAGIDPPHPV